MSEAPVVGKETEEEWRKHRRGVEKSLVPVGHLEMCLVERIALLFWRLRRVTRFETETTTMALAKGEAEWEKEDEWRRDLATVPFYGEAVKKSPLVKETWIREREASLLVPEDQVLERVMRYEAHLHRQLLQSMHELEALQARRQGDLAPLARLDVAGGPVMASWRRERRAEAGF
jgi:hypothetical protein